MEPLIGVNFAHFAPYGSGQLNGENLLTGTFGSASLDGVSDYYSQLAYKVRCCLHRGEVCNHNSIAVSLTLLGFLIYSKAT